MAQGIAQAPPATPPTAGGYGSSNQTPATQNPPGTIPQPTPATPGVVTGITLGELYTSNLTLTPPGQPQQSDLTTEIQPFLKAAYSAPRFSGLLDYSLQGFLYRRHPNNNQYRHNLDAQGTLTLLPEHFFLDGTALYSQQIINNAAPAGSGQFFVTNNRANAASSVLSPYWMQDFGRVGKMTLRYGHGRVAYNDHGISGTSGSTLSGVSDVTSNSLQFALVSPRDMTLGWDLTYYNQRLDPDFGPGIEFGAATLGTSLQVSGYTRLLADAGRENNFLPNGTVQKLGASFWDAGFEWSNTLNDFKMLVGHRFFGRSYHLSWTHMAALLTTTLSYTEQATDYNQQLLGRDPEAMLVSPLAVPQIPSLLQSQVYLSKRATASASYQTVHSTLTVTLYDELRTFITLSNGQERVADADLSWQFDIGVFTALTPTFGWQRYSFQNGQVNYTAYGQLALTHQFSPASSASLLLRRESRNAYPGAITTPGQGTYRVNLIMLQWTHLF
ncbi:MAG: TIGR03016 family PEP-CTERM system-associated outer membrane protein [Gammaproteobacteria bacterium]|nr:TIGR03016 family PEP-CTERM system-associated outer membrane protein [Gammaproteobacteria bacterium]